MRQGVLVGVVVVWLSLTGAAAAWTSAVTISPPGEYEHQAVVAMGGDGRAAVAWSRYVSPYESHLEARLRDPGANTWRPVQLVSPAAPGQNYDPALAVDAHGDALVVWSNGHTIFSAYAPAGKDFEPSTIVATDPNGTGAQYPFVAFDAAGQATAVWFEADYLIHYAVRPPGEEFGPDQTVQREPELTWATSEAVAANGAAAITWADTRVWLSQRPPGGVFGPPRPLSGAAILAGGSPHLGIDPTGNVTVAWSEYSGSGPYETMRAAAVAADGTILTPATTLATTWSGQAVVAVNPAGEATIVWPGSTVVPDVYAGLTAVTRPAGQPFGAPEAIAPAELGTDDLPAFAYDSTGATRVLWRHYDDNDATHTRLRVFAQDRPPGGGFREQPSTIGATMDVTTPTVMATGPGGSAIAAWTYGWAGLGPVEVTFDGPAMAAAPDPAADLGSSAAKPEAGAAASLPVASGRPARCHVPSLAGLSRSAARARLRHAHCALGSIRREHSRHRRGRVIRQRPAAGKWLARNGRVAVVLAA